MTPVLGDPISFFDLQGCLHVYVIHINQQAYARKKMIFEFQKQKKNEEGGTWAKVPTPKEAEFINEQMNEHVFKYRNEGIDKGEKNG